MANKNEKNEKVKNNKSFFKELKAELKKVTWSTPKQLVNSTIGVIVIVIIVAIIVFVLDLTFDGINKQGINRLKGIVESKNVVVEDTIDNDENNDESEISGETSEENNNEIDEENKLSDDTNTSEDDQKIDTNKE